MMTNRLFAAWRRRTLRRRWVNQEDRIEAIIDDVRSGADWTRHLRASPGRWNELKHLSSCPRQQLESNAAPRDLRGIRLAGVDLAVAPGLSDTALDFAQFHNVSMTGLTLSNARLQFAEIGPDSELARCRMSFCDLRCAQLCESSLDGACVSDSDLRGATFSDVTLANTTFSNIRFSIESVGGRWFGPGPTTFRSSSLAAIRIADDSDLRFCDHLDDELSITRLERSRPIVARMWHMLANYGRSPLRVLAWAVGIWAFFGWLYAGLPSPVGAPSFRPRLIRTSTCATEVKGFAPYYFSAVTLTTLGYGDIAPAPGSTLTQILICLEALLGVFLWGALVSVFLQNTLRSPP